MGTVPEVRGVFHVHTNRSDGEGSVEDVAAAAADAGLDFLVITDHGSGDTAPDPPAYLSGVLVIDAVEISTSEGHVIAFDMPASPYRLGGEARDVVEDVHRLGGFAVAAHPGSPVASLTWTDAGIPVSGFEWINGDSSWRDESWFTLASAAASYPFEPVGALTALFDQPLNASEYWDSASTGRPVVGLPGIDAHGRVGFVPVPSYAQAFRVLSIRLPGVSFAGDAALDAPTVSNAIRAGHVYTAVDGIARLGSLRFTAAQGGRAAVLGDALPREGPIQFTAEVIGPEGHRIELLHNGEVLTAVAGSILRYESAGNPGAYRIEVTLDRAPGTPQIPWLVSNPIYVEGVAPQAPPDEDSLVVSAWTPMNSSGEWSIEASPGSEGAIDQVTGVEGEPETLLRFALSGRESDSPFVAFVVPADEDLSGDAVVAFDARADKPVRIDVQLREALSTGENSGPRWHRSVYVGPVPQSYRLPLRAFRPRDPEARGLPGPVAIGDVLFVIDTVNTAVGTGGRVWIADPRLGL